MASGGIAALGFAPHSGWAVVVGMGGAVFRPRVLLRERVLMADPQEPEARQPYHAVEGSPIEEAARRLAAYAAAAERMAQGAIRQIVDGLAGQGHTVIEAGVLESSGRASGSLAATLASHALIHTADGNHFRNALAGAASRCALVVSRVPARELHSRAAGALSSTPDALRKAIRDLGHGLGPPWGVDQKSAALLAWLVLARASARGRRGPGTGRHRHP